MVQFFDFCKEIPFSTWSEFRISWFDRIQAEQRSTLPRAESKSHDVHRRRYAFRGQACASWPLWTSFDRVFAEYKKLEDPRSIYEDYFRNFIVASIRNGVTDYRDLTRTEPEYVLDENKLPLESLTKYESLARHWGLPTRLLDWTWSVYVATFFAFWRLEDLQEPHSAIWVLDLDETLQCFDDSIYFVDDIYPNNPNRLAQDGIYTRNMSNVLMLDQLFERDLGRYRKRPRFPVLFKALIPTGEKFDILSDLDRMRISRLRMFPGQEGLVSHYRHALRSILEEHESRVRI